VLIRGKRSQNCNRVVRQSPIQELSLALADPAYNPDRWLAPHLDAGLADPLASSGARPDRFRAADRRTPGPPALQCRIAEAAGRFAVGPVEFRLANARSRMTILDPFCLLSVVQGTNSAPKLGA